MKNLFTQHAILKLNDLIIKSLENKEFGIAVFIDLKKAFDTIDHEILLYKLSYYGIRGIPLEWFRSYLSDRSQLVGLFQHLEIWYVVSHRGPF